MSRDDGALYSGLTSASLQAPVNLKQEEQKADKQRERLAKRQEVQDKADPILALVEKYKLAATHVLNVTTGETMTDKEAGELMRSQRRVYATLVNLEANIKAILKDPA